MRNEEEPTAPSTERPRAEPEFSDSFTFCGQCGKRHCPEIRKDPAGGVVLSEEIADMVDVVPGRSGIPLSREDAVDLRIWLQKNGF